MLKQLALPAVFLLLVSSPTVHAAYEDIYNVTSAPVPAGLTAAQIESAVTTGGASRGWVVERQGEGHLLATLNVRSHTVRADIHFDLATYSITYRDSENLKFRKGKIHGAYNKWIRNLKRDIDRQLALVSL